MTYFVLSFEIFDNKEQVFSFLVEKKDENAYAKITIDNGVASIDFFNLGEDGDILYQGTEVYSLANIQKITFKNLKSVDRVIYEIERIKEGK